MRPTVAKDELTQYVHWASCMLAVQESLPSTLGQTTNSVGSPWKHENEKIPVERLSN